MDKANEKQATHYNLRRRPIELKNLNGKIVGECNINDLKLEITNNNREKMRNR